MQKIQESTYNFFKASKVRNAVFRTSLQSFWRYRQSPQRVRQRKEDKNVCSCTHVHFQVLVWREHTHDGWEVKDLEVLGPLECGLGGGAVITFLVCD